VKVAEKCKSQAMTKANLTTIIADKLKFPLGACGDAG
jgi:hypothetical protein